MTFVWPWQDRQRRFSALKAAAFALMLAPGAWLSYEVWSGEYGLYYPMWLGGLTYWSGMWATAVLLLALAVTPAMVILDWRRLMAVRRMIGVAALIYTIAHLIIYFGLRFFNFTVIGKELLTPFLLTATLSTLGLIVLGVTSVDAAIARMGARGWQRLHDTVYVITALAVLHALLSRGTNPLQYLLAGIFFWLMAWRVLDRYGRGSDAKALALLALGTTGFAVLLEVVCVWIKRGYPPSETLSNNFTLLFGIPATWELLGLGLLIALSALRPTYRVGAPRVTRVTP